MKRFFPALLLLLIILVVIFPVFRGDNAPRKNSPHSSSGYWVVNMADNETLTHTSVPLSVGDEYITAENKIYRITKIVNDKAYVKELK
ncbi:MAG: hypothetical protein ACOX47_08410 [Bacillota bacterium]